MPTYEYQRPDGSRFEVFQGINEAPLTECPDTGQPVQRVISGGAGVVYKGSGWYVTDYKSRGASDAPKEGEKSAPDTDTPAPASAPAESTAPAPSGTDAGGGSSS